MGVNRILAATALAAALAVPATAAASSGHGAARRTAVARAKAPTPISAAAAVGRRYWGAVPCNGEVTIRAQRSVPAGMDPTTDAWVTFDSSLGANNLAAPATSYTNCTIAFARWRWSTSASMLEDWDIFCTTMTHELGHLLGRQHDSTPGSVMAPVFTDQSSVPAMCVTTRSRR
jgi:hypothetical protein